MKRKILLTTFVALLSFSFIYAEETLQGKELKRGDPHVGRRFHEKTKMIWGQVARTASILVDKNPPPRYKDYPDAEKIELPLVKLKGKSAENTIKEIIPDGNFSKEAISLEELSQILFSADGIIRKKEEIDIRTAPVPLPRTLSFTYVHPVEIYVVAHRVTGLKKGLYHYSFLDHSLELISDKVTSMSNCCFAQSVLDSAAASIIFTGIPARLTARYDTRSYRYIYMTAGAVSQNIYRVCIFRTEFNCERIFS